MAASGEDYENSSSTDEEAGEKDPKNAAKVGTQWFDETKVRKGERQYLLGIAALDSVIQSVRDSMTEILTEYRALPDTQDWAAIFYVVACLTMLLPIPQHQGCHTHTKSAHSPTHRHKPRAAWVVLMGFVF